MEHAQSFMLGVIFALTAVYAGLRFYRSYQRKKERAEYIPPQATYRGSRPDSQRHKH